MKLLLSVVVILAFANYVHGVNCTRTPDICNNAVACGATADTCKGMLIENGGVCGCCNMCITLLNEGDSCMMVIIMGPTVMCDAGLHCDLTTYTCQKREETTT